MFSNLVKATIKATWHLFLDFNYRGYGINSVQTNRIKTTACVIVKLQPEQIKVLKEISYKTKLLSAQSVAFGHLLKHILDKNYSQKEKGKCMKTL